MIKIYNSLIILLLYISLCISSTLGGQIFISNEGSDNITVIDLNTYEIISNIKSGKRPRDMKIIKKSNKLLVAASEDDKINIIDTNTHKLIAEIETGDDPEIFDISPDGKIIVVSKMNDII